MARKALVICNGEPPSRALARRFAATSDFIVAADGGANIGRRYGIRPDVIIGDLDSISGATKRRFSSSTLLHVARQDNTDLEKALDYLSALEFRNVTILAATGHRIDFTLGNLSSLWSYTSFLDLTVAGDGWWAVPVGRRKHVEARVGTTASLIPFGDCDGITLRGLRYPLADASMKVGEIGVSNVVRKSPFAVQVRRGHMLLIVFEDPLKAGKRRR